MEGTLKSSTMKRRRELLSTFPADVEAVSWNAHDWILRHDWVDGTRYTTMLAIRVLFRWADVPNHSIDCFKPRPPLSRGAEALITPEQHQSVLDASDACYREVFTLLHATGCRPGELCSLTASDYFPESSALVLDEHKTDKNGSKRIILLTAEAREIVERHIKEHPTGLLFWSTNGLPLRTNLIQFAMRRACKKKKIIPILFPYCYRHTFATDLLARGVSETLVAGLLGHAGTVVIHKHYSHLLGRMDALREALNQRQEKKEKEI